MIPRFFSPPSMSYFLFGPRGTGKSTWLKQNYPDAYWIDLLDPVVFRFYAAGPERLRSVLAENRSNKTVVLDEIQKLPELLDVVHSLLEEKGGYQFVLTGSSARKLKKEGINLLGGRALLKQMPPFFAGELGERFDLSTNILYGMLPLVLDSPAPQEVLKAYAGLYLKEEVQAEGLVRHVGDFARFLEIMSFSQGSILNASNIARECQISRKTVDSYLLILQDLLLSFHLPVFRKKARREVAVHEKFYFFDAGVFLSLRPKNIYDENPEREGVALEGLVAQHLKGWIEAQNEAYQLHFWRTRTQLEVDFIVTGPDCFLALEVKNGITVHPKDLRGLAAFVEDHPLAQPILLYRGEHRYKEQNILCCPVEDFLLKIHPQKSLLQV